MVMPPPGARDRRRAPRVRHDALEGVLDKDLALVEDRNLCGDLADELHVVFHDDDGVVC
jgi:hypothetical protein